MAENEMNTVQKPAAPQAAERMAERNVFMPRADIYETPGSVVVLADMPGVDDTSVDITVENDVLTIRGKVDAPEFSGRKPAYAEYDVGDYERTFTISPEIDREQIEASVRNGVLCLTLPKASQARLHKIAIKAE